MQFRIVIQLGSEEAKALALDYLFLRIGILIYGRSFARLILHYVLFGWRFSGGEELL